MVQAQRIQVLQIVLLQEDCQIHTAILMTIHYIMRHGDGSSGGQSTYLSQLPPQASSSATSLTVGIEIPGVASADK
eukprot:m.163120 g.163120  ORF g.163120 m.163120 type:complete len:76 (+) comp38849_c0_seq3:405-632(+)